MNVAIAVDFGASNGRVIAGYYEDNILKVDEIHRFMNRQISMGNVLYWDFPYLFEEMKTGLRKAAQKYANIVSIGIDTWGVDFGLIDEYGQLMGNPTTYRNPRLTGLETELFQQVDIQKHYAQTGISPMNINTLFQLYYLKKHQPSFLDRAKHLLFMPDLFSYFLCGVPSVEYTIASTSELLDAKTKNWAWNLIDELGFPREIFGNIVFPGEVKGVLLPEIQEEAGLPKNVKVMAVNSHDTASAVASIDFKGKHAAFLSSGTWSLLGLLQEEPVLTEKARLDGFTNEGGGDGKIRFLQNITGLWILQSVMKEWEQESRTISYTDLIAQAENITFPTLIDVDDETFQTPLSMIKAIQSYCQKHQLKTPQTQAEFCYCILASLAYRYKKAMDNLKSYSKTDIEALIIIGGGSQNRLLNKMTEEVTEIQVITGEIEATAIGNLKCQLENG